MADDSLVQRILQITFKLGAATFTESGTDTLTVTGLRAVCQIDQAGAVGARHLSLRIYGMTLSTMNQLTNLGVPLASIGKNFVTVQAGDAVNGLSIVFTGSIFQAWVDPNEAPDVSFTVDAIEGQYVAVAPANPVSFDGPVAVTTVLQNIATQMGYGFEPNGVNVTLTNSYFSGSLRQQAYTAAQHANINIIIENSDLIVWPMGGSRDSPSPPLLSKDTGMVGYPVHTFQGLAIKSLFNPNITVGKNIQVQSVLIPAVGLWNVLSLKQELSSEMPDGPWFTTAECVTAIGGAASAPIPGTGQ